jgi:xanthine dehydrogenase molybdenum-binding subunit
VDCGTPINPDLAAGQLEGGLSRGISLALLEDTEYEPETGQLTCGGSFVDYKVFTAEDMLPLENIETFFADTYEPSGPFGAKGVGEAANNCTAGTVANAIYNAIGLRLRKTPITPEKILDALKNEEKKDEGKNNDQL